MYSTKLLLPVSIGKMKQTLEDLEVLELAKTHDKYIMRYKGLLFDFILDKYFDVIEIKAIDDSNDLKEVMDEIIENISKGNPKKIELIVE